MTNNHDNKNMSTNFQESSSNHYLSRNNDDNTKLTEGESCNSYGPYNNDVSGGDSHTNNIRTAQIVDFKRRTYQLSQNNLRYHNRFSGIGGRTVNSERLNLVTGHDTGRHQPNYGNVDPLSSRDNVSFGGKTRGFVRYHNNIYNKKSLLEDSTLSIRAQASQNAQKCFSGTSRVQCTLSKNLTDVPKEQISKNLTDVPKEQISILKKQNSGYASSNSKIRLRCHSGKSFHRTSHTPEDSVFERSTSREELQRSMSRNYFCCHEKALKDAGYEVKIRKPDGPKIMLEYSTNAHESLLSTKMNETVLEPNSALLNNAESMTVNSFNDDTTKTEAILTMNTETQDKLKENMHTALNAQTQETKNHTIKLLQNGTKKKRPETAKLEKIECKPLLMYLEYIKENKEEYLQHVHASRPVAREYTCSNSLIKLGHAFELRNHGGKMRECTEDVTVMAVKSLRPRTADFEHFYKQKEAEIKMRDINNNKLRTSPGDKPLPDKNTSATAITTTLKDEDNSKTELEKRKLKAEDWCRSVSTNTFIKAKIQSLRELGFDDIEMTNWLEAFKNCRYIRQTSF